MKKIILTILGIIIAGLSWLFIERPEPPFAGVTPTPIVQVEPTYFAEIDKNGKVLRIIVITQEFLNTGKWGDPKNWVQTYQDGTMKNYAGIGYTYDKTLNVFVPPKPYSNWVLDREKVKWYDSNKISPTASQ